jgi:CheY-specific phosphatase CheX
MPNEMEKCFGYWASVNGVTFGEIKANRNDVNITIGIDGSTSARMMISMSRITAEKIQENTKPQSDVSPPYSYDLLTETFVNLLDRVYTNAKLEDFSIFFTPTRKENGRKNISGKSNPKSLSVRVDSGLGTIWVNLSSMQS